MLRTDIEGGPAWGPALLGAEERTSHHNIQAEINLVALLLELAEGQI